MTKNSRSRVPLLVQDLQCEYQTTRWVLMSSSLV